MKAKERNVKADLDIVCDYMVRAEKYNLQCEVMWSALDLALSEGFRSNMEKQGEVVNIELCLQCACQDWDV